MNAMPADSFLPLFDRLGGVTQAGSNRQGIDTADSRHALQHDLVRILNARNGLTIDQFLDGAPNSLHYGLPDLLGLSPQSVSDLQRLERVISRAISVYEPRLVQVRVQARFDVARPASAQVTVSALAALDRQPRRIDFALDLGAQSVRIRESRP